MPVQLAPLLGRHAEGRRVENNTPLQTAQCQTVGEARQLGRRKFETALSLSALNVQAGR